MAKVVLAYHDKQVLSDGAIVEIAIWQVAAPVPGSGHTLKYRLFYGTDGKRLVEYGNKRGKGDHRHSADREQRYVCVSPEKLIDDFLAEVRRLRGEK